jgi:hypothetical protein
MTGLLVVLASSLRTLRGRTRGSIETACLEVSPARHSKKHTFRAIFDTMGPKKAVEEEKMGPWALGRFSNRLKVGLLLWLCAHRHSLLT